MSRGTIKKVAGPLVIAKGMRDANMYDVVRVSSQRLIGEIIEMHEDEASIQVYEETSGLRPGEPVESMEVPLSVELGPGLITSIYDGIQRPLDDIMKISGNNLKRGVEVASLKRDKKWEFVPVAKAGDEVEAGDVLGTVQETIVVQQKIMVPYGVKGTVKEIKAGTFTVEEVVAVIATEKGDKELTMMQRWPVRKGRPYQKKLPPVKPLVTGQRVIDTLFPIAKGGTAAIPGGFGTGKTMTQHQLAKWCDADIIVYVGCGERGNEMTQVLEEFRELVDPKSGKPLVDRTVLIANTSNMPVAAREASIYTGVTLAEYYRDMGYHVAIMADSTSRWAEALREISGRLEEMPAEEGFPAYLPSRLSQFYERAGYMENLNNTNGSVTIIGAVSPQGSDFSEPVTQNTKRFVRTFWALDKALAYARHYFAINWNLSYSEYIPDLERWYSKNVDPKFMRDRQELASILAEETKLMEIVQLMGSDVLPDDQKLVIEVARVVRVGYLQQNAFHKDDTYVPLEKQLKMMEVILYLNNRCQQVVAQGKPIRTIIETGIFDEVVKMKYDVPNNDLSKFDYYYKKIDAICASID